MRNKSYLQQFLEKENAYNSFLENFKFVDEDLENYFYLFGKNRGGIICAFDLDKSIEGFDFWHDLDLKYQVYLER